MRAEERIVEEEVVEGEHQRGLLVQVDQMSRIVAADLAVCLVASLAVPEAGLEVQLAADAVAVADVAVLLEVNERIVVATQC